MALSLILPVSAFADLNPGYESVNTIANEILDDETWAVQTVTRTHHETHEGHHFLTSDVTDFSSGHEKGYLIQNLDTSNTKVTHMAVRIQTEGEGEYTLYEGTTATFAGNVRGGINRNRTSTITSDVVWYTADDSITATVSGDNLITEHWGSATTSGRSNAGGADRDENGWILDPAKNYLLFVTDESAGANQVSVILDWIEHPSR